MKVLSHHEYSLLQLTFHRSLSAIPTLVVAAWVFGKPAALIPRDIVALLGRSLIQLSSYTFYFLGIAVLPYGNAVALTVTSPIWLVVLGAILLGEPLSLKRLGYVLIGFSGALLIAWPDSGVFQLGAAFSLLAAITYALQQLFARKLGARNSAIAMVLMLHLTMFVVASCAGLVFSAGVEGITAPSLSFLMRPWKPMTSFDIALISLCGVIHALGSIFAVQGYIIGPASTVAPFEYVALFWAVALGYLVWSEIPTISSMSGMLIIGAVGVFLLSKQRTPKATDPSSSCATTHSKRR